MAAGSPTLRTLDIRTSHFKDVLQTLFDCAEAPWKNAVEGRFISHRIVNLLLSGCLAHTKSFCEISRALCTSQKKHAKLLLQPPSKSGDRSEEVVLFPDLAFPLGRGYRHPFSFNVREP
jgi:hypothetical protein